MTILRIMALAVMAAVFAVSGGFAQDKEQSATDYFKALRLKVTGSLPAKFTGELTGKSIEAKMRNIPPDSLLNRSQRPFVQLGYSKKNGIAVVVKNVDDLYEDLYRDLPKQIFAFDLILSSENNDPFLKKYDISWYSRSAGLNVLRLGIRSAENALLLFVRPDTMQIQRIDYLMGKQLLSSTVITYGDWTNNGTGYVIPSRFITKTMDPDGKSRPETFEIGSIRF